MATLTITKRQKEAFDLRILGHSYSAIGSQMGISEQAAYNLVSKAIKFRQEHTQESLDHVLKQELDRLDMMMLACVEILKKGTVSVVTKEGEIVVVDDPEIRLKATDRLTKIIERRSKLLGMDAPTQTETKVDGPWMKFLADVVEGEGETDDSQGDS